MGERTGCQGLTGTYHSGRIRIKRSCLSACQPRATSFRPAPIVVSTRVPFQEVISELNRVREAGLIEEYAIGGAVGALAYLEAAATEDVDVFVVFGSHTHSEDWRAPRARWPPRPADWGETPASEVSAPGLTVRPDSNAGTGGA